MDSGDRIESAFHIPQPCSLHFILHLRSFVHCIFSLTHLDVNISTISSRMHSISASIALYANYFAHQRTRRSNVHTHNALRRWINGPTSRMGEPLTTAHAQLECTSEAHLTSLNLAWPRCNAPHNVRNARNAHTVLWAHPAIVRLCSFHKSIAPGSGQPTPLPSPSQSKPQ